VDRAAESWIRAHVEPVGVIETTHERPWATVLRVPLADGVAWFKACAPVQAFEPRLTAELFARWPDRVTEVLGHDEERGWLLLADAGTPIREFGNPPAAWLPQCLRRRLPTDQGHGIGARDMLDPRHQLAAGEPHHMAGAPRRDRRRARRVERGCSMARQANCARKPQTYPPNQQFGSTTV
jgi:hypothetical protein